MRLQLTLVVLLVGSSISCLGQNENEKNGILRRYFEGVFGQDEDSTASKFIHYPTLAYAPETSWEFGVSSLYVYSANRNLQNRLSEVKSFAFFTLENQYGLWLDHALYSDANKWFFYGKARYQSFPLFYYGIGRDSPAEIQSVIDGEYILIRERIMRETWPSLYCGLELDYQRLSGIEYLNTAEGFLPPEVGSMGSSNLGVGLGLIYNNIHNAMNPRKGLYSEWGFIDYPSRDGRDFRFISYIADTRIYRPIQENTVLAIQVYSQFTSGNPPFNMLALMGGESLMRGYYLGRYRDKHLVASQVEYRILPFSFSKRVGASVFMAMGQVFGENHSFEWNQFLPAGGAGLRFLIFPEKDIYTRLDWAVTAEGSGIYFFIGEAF